MPDGICPFADMVLDQSKLIGWDEGYFDRVGFCDHTAGGYYETMTRESFWNNPDGKPNTDDAVSVHAAIAQDGRLVQILNIFDTAYAQGRLGPRVTWPHYDDMGRRNPNLYLISIEHEDKTVTNYKWSEAMYQKDLAFKRWCIEEVKRVTGKNLMRFGIESLTGHHMFDGVNRPYCPGTGWPRQRLYTDLTSTLEDEMFIRWNGQANPEFWTDRKIDGQSGFNVRADFNLPIEAKEVEVEVFIKDGFLTLMDGGFDARAGYVYDTVPVNHFRVKLDSNGHCWMQGTATIDKFLCLGYYT